MFTILLIICFQVDIYVLEPEGFSTLNVVNPVAKQFADLINVDRGDQKVQRGFIICKDYRAKKNNCPLNCHRPHSNL